MANPSIDYPSVLADLKARRDRLNAAIAAVEQIIGELHPGQTGSVQSDLGTAYLGRNGSDIYRKMTIKDAAIHFIRSNGGRQSTLDVVHGLKDGGVKSKSKKLYTTIYNTLAAEANHEKGQVIRNDDKSWGLRAAEQ